MSYTSDKEGSLEAPVRHPIDWQDPAFYDKNALESEMERVFDICHTCRRCVSLCNAFPSLFDLIDESETMELDSVPKASYESVVDECFMCDLCYLTKCPYVPPHDWDVDFPHLMLRAKAVKFSEGRVMTRDKLLTSTVAVGKFAGLPIVSEIVNAVNTNKTMRKVIEKVGGIHSEAPLPKFERPSYRQAVSKTEKTLNDSVGRPRDEGTEQKVALFVTCYGNQNSPSLVSDMQKVFEHNGIMLRVIKSDSCCGMPKFELGDLESVRVFADQNMAEMKELAEQGFVITAPIPSCVLMYRKELPLLLPNNEAVQLVAKAMRDPFEILIDLKRSGQLNMDFTENLGNVAYHAPCHQRVQNIGYKTKEILELVPNTNVTLIERCSGHDGTYAVKHESYPQAKKICRPIVRAIDKSAPDIYISDCPMAFDLIDQGTECSSAFKSAFAALKFAYGVE